MTYQVLISRRAVKSINKLSQFDRNSVEKILIALSINPRPRNAKKLTDSERYRVRVSNYRILYTIDDGVLIINVVDVLHRRNAYRD